MSSTLKGTWWTLSHVRCALFGDGAVVFFQVSLVEKSRALSFFHVNIFCVILFIHRIQGRDFNFALLPFSFFFIANNVRYEVIVIMLWLGVAANGETEKCDETHVHQLTPPPYSGLKKWNFFWDQLLFSLFVLFLTENVRQWSADILSSSRGKSSSGTRHLIGDSALKEFC